MGFNGFNLNIVFKIFISKIKWKGGLIYVIIYIVWNVIKNKFIFVIFNIFLSFFV